MQKKCRDLPKNSNLPSSQNIGVHKMAWKTSHSTRIIENPNSKHQLLSNREQGQFQSKTKESVSCPNNHNCQYRYKCIHFQALSPPKRKDHVMKQNLCFNCFGHHHVDQCNSKNVCRSKGCGKRHNTFLHDSFMNKSNSNVKPVQFVGTGQVAFVAVQLINGNQSVKTYAYLDNGSCQSLLLKSTAKELGLNLEKTGKMPLSVYHTTKEIDSSKVCFDIKPIDSSVEPVRLNDVMAVPDLNMSAVNVAQLNALCNNYDHLSHVSFPELERNNVSIIIGIDNLDLIHYKQIVKGPKNAPWGVETPLGWTCAGKTNLVFNESTTVQYTQVENCPNMDNSLLIG